MTKAKAYRYTYEEEKEDKGYLCFPQDLEDIFREICDLSDEDFKKQLPRIIHFSCYVLFLKRSNYRVLSDIGILHELIHLLHINMLSDDITFIEFRMKWAQECSPFTIDYNTLSKSTDMFHSFSDKLN